MEYHYGSEPRNYGYMDFVKHLAPVLPENDKVFFYKNQLDWRNNYKKIPLELFRNICHWKSPRRFTKNVLSRYNTEDKINKHWQNALRQLKEGFFQDNAIKCALKELRKIDGVQVPTASALLTAWNPKEFGIIDFRVLAVLSMTKSFSLKSYVEYHKRLLDIRNNLRLHKCTLRQIEFAIWHYYSIQGSGRRERPDE